MCTQATLRQAARLQTMTFCADYSDRSLFLSTQSRWCREAVQNVSACGHIEGFGDEYGLTQSFNHYSSRYLQGSANAQQSSSSKSQQKLRRGEKMKARDSEHPSFHRRITDRIFCEGSLEVRHHENCWQLASESQASLTTCHGASSSSLGR